MPTPVAALLVVVGAWVALFGRQVEAGFSNVDDYLYALQTRALLSGVESGPPGLVSAWKLFGDNSPLVPTLALPFAAISDDPMLLVVVQLPVLLVTLAGLVVLARSLGVSVSGSWWVAAGVTVLPGLLGYAVMLHFAVASTACVVWVLAAYLRSDRLRSRAWSAGVGLAAGLLTLSRVVAVVYAAAVGLVFAYDFLTERSDLKRRAVGAALALGLGALTAAPWWLTAGPAAVRYLLNAGYDASSGFAPQSGLLQKAVGRLIVTAQETGVLLCVILVSAFVVATVDAVRHRDRPVLLVVSIATASFGGLVTSSNAGTAFALPVTVLMALVVLSAAARGGRLLLMMAQGVVGLSLLVLLLPVDARFAGSQALWLSGSPGLSEARSALGRPVSGFDAEALVRDIAGVAGRRTLLVTRDDALLNSNTFAWTLPKLSLRSPNFGATSLIAMDLNGDAVLTGRTLAPYHPGLSPTETEHVLRARGYRLAFHRALSPNNDVEVWIPR